MIALREYSEENDYDMLCGWWESHGWPHVNRGFLRPLGIIVSEDDTDTVAAWLLPIAGCGIAIMEWVVSNPEANGKAVIRGIRKLTSFFEDWCKDPENDYGVIITVCRQESLANVHRRNGFEETDRDVIHLAKVVE